MKTTDKETEMGTIDNNGHTLYTSADFTNEEADNRNVLYVYVVEGGLSACKVCGAAEIELSEMTCRDRQAAIKAKS